MTFETSLRNKVQITLTSFLAYFLMSSVISQLGIVSGSMALYFDISVGEATALFSYLTTGLLFGSLVAMISFTPLGLKSNILFASALLIAALTCLWKIPHLLLIPAAFTVIGLSCGLLMSAATVVITWCYSDKHRAQMLLITDSFYSSAGVVTGLFAGHMIGRGAYWGSSYILALCVSALILVLALFSKYPSDSLPADGNEPAPSGPWPPSMLLIGLAIFVYIASFILIYAWVPNYATQAFSATPEQGGALVGRLFSGMFFGQIATFFLVFVLKFRWLITVLAIAALGATCGLWMSETLPQLMVTMLCLGLLTGGILKLLLTLGTLTTPNPSARMISFLFFCTAIGSSFAPAAGAKIVSMYGEKTALMTVSGGYAVTVIILVTALTMMKASSNSVKA
ncbi:MAG: MFS transporter TsgA [Alphaproteobacteria bacterium]